MREAILHFPEQFAFEPTIVNAKDFTGIEKFIICGMGGSALAGDIVKNWQEDIDLRVHKDYGLPRILDKSSTLVIAASYSGDTEEPISSFQQAIEQNIPLIAVTTGGQLKKLAIENAIPYVELSDSGIQPRAAVGFQMMALVNIIASAMPEKRFLPKELSPLQKSLVPQQFEAQGKAFAKQIKGKTPLIYSSSKWQALIYNWKIKFNENAKVAAFWNIFPELNHNEMTGFDVQASTEHILKAFHFILLKDENDDPRIQKRQEVFEKILTEKGFSISTYVLEGDSFARKFFTSTLLADWTSYYLALEYGNDPEQVPLVEDFKRMIKLK